MNDGGPAYPHTSSGSMGAIRDHRGMSLRAHLACEMAKSMITNFPGARFDDKNCCDAFAEAAVMMADALIAKLAVDDGVHQEK